MDRTVKQVIAAAAAAFVVAAGVYGSYLPLRKAQMFIATLQSLQSNPASSLSDLESRISIPLDYPSPIGQEELVRNVANSILSFVQRSNDATTTANLLAYLHSYYDPILNRGTGMSFGQDVYLMGAVNEIAFAGTGNPAYLLDAQKYYTLGNKLGPNRPQPLYGLFDVYRAEGDVTGTVRIANTILANWPADARIAQAVTQFMAERSQTPTSTRKSPK